MSWHFFWHFLYFWQCLLLKAEIQIKLHYHCNMGQGEWSIFSKIRFLLKVEIIISDLASAPAPGNKSTIHFRHIHACDATPFNVKKAQKKTTPKLLDLGWTPLPPFGWCLKVSIFFGGMASLRQTYEYWLFFLYTAIALQWSFVAILWNK